MKQVKRRHKRGPFGLRLSAWSWCEHGDGRPDEPQYKVPVRVGPDLVGDVEPVKDKERAA